MQEVADDQRIKFVIDYEACKNFRKIKKYIDESSKLQKKLCIVLNNQHRLMGGKQKFVRKTNLRLFFLFD